MAIQGRTTPTTVDTITAQVYRGDGSVLIGIDLNEKLTTNLAGFSIKRTDPDGTSKYLSNRLNFTQNITTATTPQQREWTTSDLAPFQKFSWVDFPSNVVPGTYQYEVTAQYFDINGKLKPGNSATATVDVKDDGFSNFEVGFTRGYMSSQAYADAFANKPIRPAAKSLTYDTTPYAKQYEWLGFHARKMVFDFLNDCINDKECSVDLFAYDLDEPDFVSGLVKLGSRLRAYLDDAPLHTKPGALEIEAAKTLQQSAGTSNVKQGHFQRFSHDKILIKKDNTGTPVKVLTGSANFSVRGLYVQANNVLVFNDATTAALYGAAFDQSFNAAKDFKTSEIADGWHDLASDGIPKCSVAFSPHTSADVSLGKVADAIKNAKSSVLFAVMELGGSGTVMDELTNIINRSDIFSYGMTQTLTGVKVYKPNNPNGIIVPFSYLKDKVPAPFKEETSGGIGQVIHHKFVVIDFNDETPMVFAGSSNLAAGGEEANGDNLICIQDPIIARTYAVEAIRLVDHFHFRAAMKDATDAAPLSLKNSSDAPWWKPYYDSNDIKCRERGLFA